jgi:aminopeptidase
VAGSTQTSPSAVSPATLARYAELIVELGANVQPGQVVEIRADLAKRDLVRAIAEAAYRRGAKFVDAVYHDPWVRRARIEHAREALDFVPDYARRRVLRLGELRAARITLTPLQPPALFEELDPARVATELSLNLPEYLRLVNEETTSWTGVSCPDPDWAARVHPGLEPDEALARLWEQVVHVTRLDEPDPVTAWHERFDQLERAARALAALELDALHFEGPGTDLTIGLLPGSIWTHGPARTVDGIVHAPNLPTEEVFTAPDPQSADGVVRSTKPLVTKTGTLVEGLVVRFEGGRAIAIDADRGGEALRAELASHENGDRLGEVALVDRESRVGRLDTVFYTTLLDENAASHVALGSAYPKTVAESDRGRINASSVHVDFMVGGDDVDVTGITRDGRRVPVLRGGAWQI